MSEHGNLSSGSTTGLRVVEGAPEAQDPDTGRLRAIQRAVQRLATMPEAPEDAAETFARWGLREDDAQALASFSRERTGVYAGLVGRTVLGAVMNQLPATVRWIPEDTLRALVQRYLEESPPRSPYLRDVPFELARWAAGQWGASGAPDFLPDLARFELLAFAAGSTEAGPLPLAPEPLRPDRGAWLHGSVHLARFRYAVHDLEGGGGGGELRVPDQRDVALLVYRDSENEVRWMELPSLAMEVLERLASGTALGQAVQDAAGTLGREINPTSIEEVSDTLARLAERGALLGAAPAGEPLPARRDLSPHWHWLLTGQHRI